jgi:predicted metalloprotease
MRWNQGRRSDNLEDRRGEGGMVRRGAGIGIGGIALIAIVGLLTGQNPLTILSQILGSGGTEVVQGPAPSQEDLAREEPQVQFVGAVLDSAQATWHRRLPARGGQYVDAKLVLFRDGIESACGLGQAAMGPFYCPGDQKVYIDLGFYDELQQRFGAPGDFAQAYVIAHEIGHHVQNLLGIERQVRELQQQNPGQQNALSVALELQADCYAGIWAYDAQKGGYLDAGDPEEALNAAASIGDDRIQKSAGARVSPESFTHGSSEQRMTWFRRGMRAGDIGQCDTFAQ